MTVPNHYIKLQTEPLIGKDSKLKLGDAKKLQNNLKKILFE